MRKLPKPNAKVRGIPGYYRNYFISKDSMRILEKIKKHFNLSIQSIIALAINDPGAYENMLYKIKED